VPLTLLSSSLVAADLFTVLERNANGRTPYECALHLSCSNLSGYTGRIHLLKEEQDEAIRRIRDTVQDLGVKQGLPDLVVSNAYLCLCSIASNRWPG
jgi:hypothetical protein